MSTHPNVRPHVYKINLLSGAIKYLSTGFPKRGMVQWVRHPPRRALLLAVETLFLQALSFRFFYSKLVPVWHQVGGSASRWFPWWFATLEWCMTDYWENANWKPISLKLRGMKACGTSVDGWTASRTFKTEEELSMYVLLRIPRVEKNLLRLLLSLRVSSFWRRLTLKNKLAFVWIKDTKSIRFINYYLNIIMTCGMFACVSQKE